MKDQKLISIDSLSYHKITDINQENCLELLQNSFDQFVEKMQLVADYQNINNKNKIQTNFFSFNHQPINFGCFNSEIIVQELHRFYHLKPIHNFINDQNRTEFWAQQHNEEELQDKLQNVDQYLTTKIQEDGVFYKYFGNYVFHHYLQDGQNDKGWGCAYRSCMSVISWFRENGYVDKDKVKVPSITEIQKMLIEMGDKEANFMNSSQWIGAFEVSFIIQKLIDIECKIIFLQDGADIRTKLEEFKSHFINEGTPIMFGGDQYAYSILGIDYNEDEGDAKFLILDPHYVGPDNYKNIVDKGGISWKKADLFLPNTFYNFCCPLRNKSLN
ncbi:hypothetical protein PPERSA_06792 [Pseudocohnilembus persalinus]|uniref:UFSP1/2/DUB catalytic domain-containing protein n=1 Tax=Pseudocohnilembus persalinus TaxID=266149 RepID=A0A0V0QSE0_PSEPJ|nr:hypothetical protein PPERSA_06792 [Pseudocohnilembus persalinus]|eukprot:KRX05158.1 hypothetical protein PPERSA_06792 [Pseudocohnilembus persalinus]